MAIQTPTKPQTEEPVWWSKFSPTERSELINNLPSEEVFNLSVEKYFKKYNLVPPDGSIPFELRNSVRDWCQRIVLLEHPQYIPQQPEETPSQNLFPPLHHGLGQHGPGGGHGGFHIETPTEEMGKDTEFQRIHQELKQQRSGQWEKTKGKTIADWERNNKESINSEAGQAFLSQIPENPDSIIVRQSAELTFREKFPEQARRYDAIEKTKIFQDPSQDPVYRQIQKGIDDAVKYDKQNAAFSAKLRGKKQFAFDETAVRQQYEKKYFSYLAQYSPEKTQAYAARPNANPRLREIVDQQNKKGPVTINKVVSPQPQIPQIETVAPVQIHTPQIQPQIFNEPPRRQGGGGSIGRIPSRENPFGNITNRFLGKGFNKFGGNILKTGIKQAAQAGAKALVANPYFWVAVGIIAGVILLIIIAFAIIMLIASLVNGGNNNAIQNFTFSVNGPTDAGNNNVAYTINASYKGGDNILITDAIPTNTTLVPASTTGIYTNAANTITWDVQGNKPTVVSRFGNTYTFTITLHKTATVQNSQIVNQIYAIDQQTHRVVNGIGPTITPSP